MAMLLIIVTLATLTVMTAAYLTSRGNSMVIAQNATEAIETQAATDTAGDLAEAILQADVDLTPEQIQTLIASLNIFGTDITVTATDLNGGVPTGATEALIVTAKATQGVQTYAAQHLADFNPEAGEPVDISGFDWRTGEFAMFAVDNVYIRGSSMVCRWTTAPPPQGSSSVKIGANSDMSGCITIESGSAIASGAIYTTSDASDSAVDDQSGYGTTVIDLPTDIPILRNTLPNISGVPFWWDPWWLSFDGGTHTVSDAFRVDYLSLKNDAVVTVSGDVTIVVDTYFEIDGATLLVDGNLTLGIVGNGKLKTNAAIELTDGSSLTIYVKGTLSVDDSAIGFTRAIQASHAGADTALDYADPAEILILGANNEGYEIRLDHGSIVRAHIHAPYHYLKLDHQSALYGCALARNIEFKDRSYAHYDHALDFGFGFTVFDGPLYDDDDDLIDGVEDAVAAGDASGATDAIIANQTVEADSVITATPPAPGDPTLRLADRCQAHPRPTKAHELEGRPLAHAED
ncbi:MAG: hypothetical protein KAS72_07070 [Phycisphaerales bacterium]|nr:hypothetical protein [Phycisphaerales bacterium]